MGNRKNEEGENINIFRKKRRQEMKKNSYTYICLFIFLLPLLAAGCISPDTRQVVVQPGWFVEAAKSIHFARISTSSDGSILASTRKGVVYAIDTKGSEKIVYRGGSRPPYPFVSFNPGGKTFGVLAENTFTLFDAGGKKLGMIETEHGMIKQIPSTTLLFSPEVKTRSDEEWEVTGGRIINPDGTTVSSFPVRHMQFSRLTKEHIFYAAHKEFRKTAFTGKEEWQIPLAVRKFEISAEGTMIIINSASDSKRVLHYKDNSRTGEDIFLTPVWNLAISADGVYSAATSQVELRMYYNGKTEKKIRLPVFYAVSLDINEKGEVLVGGQDENFTSHVMMYSKAGVLLWEEKSIVDANAWRPEVRFTPGGETFIIRYKNGIKQYTIKGGY
jgi:hypothetical protein